MLTLFCCILLVKTLVTGQTQWRKIKRHVLVSGHALLFSIERHAKPLTVRSCSPRNRFRLTVWRAWTLSTNKRVTSNTSCAAVGKKCAGC